MSNRAINVSIQCERIAREIVSPIVGEIGQLNAEAARLLVTANRPNLTDADGRDLLNRVAAAKAALLRIEGQLSAALVGQPSEIAEHGRIKDARAAMDVVSERLRATGA